MHLFDYKNGELYAEHVAVKELVHEYGTPLYIYSGGTLRRHFQVFDTAFAPTRHLTCYSVKANSNLSVLKLLAKEGAGVDIVSGGELFRALRAGINPQKIVYSGVGKKETEIREALYAGILLFNVESRQEVERINQIAGQENMTANVSLRINPDVDPKTHPYISTGLRTNKFGLSMDKAMQLYLATKDMPHIRPAGLDCHIGSQLTEISPFLEALNRLKDFYARLQRHGIAIEYLDLGGGLGITYDQEEPPHPKEFAQALQQSLAGMDLTLIFEPGRVIAGNAGILVTEVQYVKQGAEKTFVITDAAMNDLIRPALYKAYHRIAPVEQKQGPGAQVDVVGPVCESGDYLAQNITLPQVQPKDLLAVFSAGAYGFTMSSQYNSRPRAAEILVDKGQVRVARKRETYQELIALEE